MYLRHATKRTKGGKRTYWSLVRSVRRKGKVVQEVVAYLGRLGSAEVREASAIARHFLGAKLDQLELFDDRRELGPEHVEVGKVRVERGRAFGDVWMGWLLWRALDLDGFCSTHLRRGREAVPWAEIASILAIARLCEPSSELYIAETWYQKSALSDLLGVGAEAVHHTRLYQGLDRLLEKKVELQRHVKERMGALFSLDYDLLLYDVTSTYFEGQAALNKKAQRGHSRDNRSDCKQVCIGLVVTKEGYPLGFEVFAGNRADVTTVEDIVETMETRYGKARRIWIWDRGMTSEANLAWMRDTGRPYLVGTPRAELKKWEREFVDRRGWATVRDGLEAKQCQGPDGAETFVLCRSEDRRKKEAAMHERFSERIVAGLESLSRRIQKAEKPLDIQSIERQIGRLLQKNQRAAGKFDVRVEMDTDTKAGLRLRYKEKPEWKDWASLTEGAYILRSNVKEWTAEDLWQAYITLTDVEGAFRIHKSDLKIRPIWHHLERRVDAHILVCFLAYALWKTLEGWQKRAGLGSSPRTILDELKKIRTVDVVLPLDNGRDATLRCVVRPDPDQAMLLDRLGLRLPQRLRPTSGDGQM